MWPLHPLIAIDMAADRARAAREEADRSRLARLAREGSPAGHRPSARLLAARALRALGAIAASLGGRASVLASRLEGRTA
jgi:hypothetical protein